MESRCPICGGSGELPESYKNKSQKVINNKIMARVLKKEGYSVRQIMKFMDYKSPNSVQKFLHN